MLLAQYLCPAPLEEGLRHEATEAAKERPGSAGHVSKWCDDLVGGGMTMPTSDLQRLLGECVRLDEGEGPAVRIAPWHSKSLVRGALERVRVAEDLAPPACGQSVWSRGLTPDPTQ